MMIRTFVKEIALALALCLAAPAATLAQDDEEGGGGWGEDESAGEGENAGDAEDASEGADEGEPDSNGDAEASGEDAPEQDAASAGDGKGDGERSWYFGPFARYVLVPSFMLKVFLAQAPTVGNGAVGIIADYRTHDGPTLEIGLGYTGYGFDGPMQADKDPETDTEWIESDLALIHLTGSVLWDTDISEKFAFEYGVGLDLGILIGDLVRTEAYKSGDGFAKCPSALPPPDPRAAYCEFPNSGASDAYDATGAHYNVVEERIPPIGGGFMLPHLALRYQPIPELALKLEAAYGIVQFWFGLSVAYAPKI
jgi:hypothetical protein